MPLYKAEPGEELYEPQVECGTCRKFRSIRWFQQSTIEFVNVPHPVTGEDRWYGKPYHICPSCHKGSWRGSRSAQPGKVYMRP